MRYVLVGLLFALMIGAGLASAGEYPNGYTHRPIMELFTSTSCGPCMNYADPAIAELWETEGDTPEQPWVFIAFHQSSGGALDDKFVTDESKERAEHYLVQATPTAEFDGGYIEVIGGGEDTKDEYDQDFDDSGNRDDEIFSATDFKEVTMYIHQEFDGDGFMVNVSVEYPIDLDDKMPTLDGTLEVFMVEDDIWAYSSALDEVVLLHNVFRGYAIKDMDVQLNQGDSATFIGRWDIPHDVEVPVDPLNVFAVAVLYDDDDTSSEREADGNHHAQSPRAVQCTTPRATLYDLGEEGPIIGVPEITWNGRAWDIEVYLNDDDNMSSAWIFYTTNYTENSTDVIEWQWAEMILPSECHGPVCDIASSGIAKVEIELGRTEAFYFRIVAYDGNKTASISDIMNSVDYASSSKGDKGGTETLPLDPSLFILAVAFALIVVARRRRRE